MHFLLCSCNKFLFYLISSSAFFQGCYSSKKYQHRKNNLYSKKLNCFFFDLKNVGTRTRTSSTRTRTRTSSTRTRAQTSSTRTFSMAMYSYSKLQYSTLAPSLYLLYNIALKRVRDCGPHLHVFAPRQHSFFCRNVAVYFLKQSASDLTSPRFEPHIILFQR